MKKRQLALTLGSIITFIILLFSSCKKINESTELGGDLIPPIDNINTFDTTITVEAYNGLFTLGGTNPLTEDSTRSSYTDEQFLGVISNDPIFGTTDAQMFFELKPPSYPYTFLNKPTLDSLFLDSVVLVLDYVGTYGDTISPQRIEVSEINSNFRVDTAYIIRQNTDITSSGLLNSPVSFPPYSLKDSAKNFLDTTSRQLRIKLNKQFGERLLQYDTTGANNAYSSDSVFKTKFKGFALKSTSGNAIMGFNLQGPNTKLAIYYKYAHGKGLSDLDTTVTYFTFFPYATYGLGGSASHNYVNRVYSGAMLAAQGGTTPDPLVYIQNTPGSFATIKIPALPGLSNRVVHRAELIAEEVYDLSDSLFHPPPYLFIDAFDPVASKYRNVPYDLVYDGTSGSFNFASFGILPVNALDGSGNVVRTWHLNLTRYVQHVVNHTSATYDLRLFSPFFVTDQYYAPVPTATAVSIQIPINPYIAQGRVRLAGNTGPADTNPHRMRLRIIYSKL